MLARYLGSKQEVLRPLLQEVGAYAKPGDRVVDAFSGSLSVSLGLKRAGYRVSANDVNLFSSVFARSYLIPEDSPGAEARELLPRRVATDLFAEADSILNDLKGKPGYSFLEDPQTRARYLGFVALQRHLATLELSDLPPSYQASHFHDAYCEAGAHSAYLSSRGRAGRRRFFSARNAVRIDLIANQLRHWRQEGAISDQTLCALTSTFVRGVEKISNTQGTYHDFPRDKWDSRALRPLTLDPPALDGLLGGVGGHTAGKEQDSLDYVAGVGSHAVLYLDPPYNFRQYTAYYFLPNILCRYPDLIDPTEYFSHLKYVRGQNPEDDFVSTFCKPKVFINELRRLICRADSDAVLISYFTGKNHWSDFDSGPSDTGRMLLAELLEDETLFEPGTLRIIETPRLNYASYGGYRARLVDELMLSARRRQDRARAPEVCVAGRIPALA